MLCSDVQCCYNSSCGNIVPMFCRMLCIDAQCCYNSYCDYRLFPCFIACCVVMYSVVIIAPLVTDCAPVLSYVV